MEKTNECFSGWCLAFWELSRWSEVSEARGEGRGHRNLEGSVARIFSRFHVFSRTLTPDMARHESGSRFYLRTDQTSGPMLSGQGL